MNELARRRSPAWVRAMSDSEIHGLAFHFNRERMTADLSDRQEWLFDALMSELAYRRRNAIPGWSACSCEFCFSPFPDEFSPEDDGAG